MASVITNTPASILLILSVLKGTQCSIEHKSDVNASVGQNISLPCILSNTGENIIQLQWHKEEEHGERNLVVFNPHYPPRYMANITLELVKINNAELRGSVLHLQEVTVKDSGDYVCDIAAFPAGSIKSITKVRVTVPNVSIEVIPLDRNVVEGDTVNITCVSNPAPDKYMLLSALGYPIMESQDGKFTFQSITRSNSDLTCQPFWVSSNQHLQNLKATVHLTVDYLDNIECNFNREISVETGKNLMIACKATSSKSLYFNWMKDNMIVSTSTSLNLGSVSPDQSGTYTLTVRAQNHSRLHRQTHFTLTVMHSTPTALLSSTMNMETTPQRSSMTMTTPEPNVTMLTSQPHVMTTPEPNVTMLTSQPHVMTTPEPNVTMLTSQPHVMTTPEPNVTMLTSQPHVMTTPEPNVTILTSQPHVISSATAATATEKRLNTSTSAPSTGPVTTVHEKVTTPYTRTTSSATTSIQISDVKRTKLQVLFIIPVLLVLCLIVLLYRQYFKQTRLDMPPPFKPPPPPVKYTSVRYERQSTGIFV